MYRPTVRYDDVYRDYVDDVFRATNLDRNQIIRLALFLLPHSEKGNEVLSQHLKQNTSLPFPRWTVKDGWLWLTNGGNSALEGGTSGKDVSEIKKDKGEGRHAEPNQTRHPRTLSRRAGQVYENRTDTGTIRISFG